VARTGTGKPHGWPEFWLTWEPAMTRLARRFTLIVPELRGFGDSRRCLAPNLAKARSNSAPGGRW
jgi:pimeloyl-ACP methyl ester carboxylesterase